MKKYNIIGDILNSSGYAIHTRELAKALCKVADVKLTTNITPGQETSLTDHEVESIKKQDSDDRINVIVTNPRFWANHATKKINYVYLIFEGDKIPKSWLDYCFNEDITKIFVPSQHTKKAIEETLTNNAFHTADEVLDKLVIVPHGVDLDKFYPKEVQKNTFNFVAVKGWRNLEDRGGTQYLVKAFIEEFTNQDNVGLIIKINPAYGIPDLQKLVKELGHNKNTAPIQFMVDNIPHKSLNQIYNHGNVFVCPTRAESFGIPMIECMAAGLPVICTGYSGQIDFVKNQVNGLYVEYDMTEIKHEIMYEGVYWATPIIEDLRKKMRWAYENPKEIKKMGREALKTAREHTWDLTAKKICDIK